MLGVSLCNNDEVRVNRKSKLICIMVTKIVRYNFLWKQLN